MSAGGLGNPEVEGRADSEFESLEPAMTAAATSLRCVDGSLHDPLVAVGAGRVASTSVGGRLARQWRMPVVF